MTRTYVITGARAGIGAAAARLLREVGHTVIGVGRRDCDVVADLGTPAGRRDAARAVLEVARRVGDGRVDAVIACAGNTTTSETTVSVNYFGAVEVLEALRPALAEGPAPRAAVVTSVSVLMPSDPALVEALRAGDEPRALEIAADLADDPARRDLVEPSTKRALARWMRARAGSPDWAGAGIALNAVGPGVTLTEDSLALLATPGAAAYVDAMVPMPLNHHAPPEAVAALLVWLTSAENTHCTGQHVLCDGGADVLTRGEDIWSWDEPRAAAHFGAISTQGGS